MTVLRLVFYDSRTIQIKLSGLCTNVADYILTLDEKKSFGETLNFRRRLRGVYIFSVSTTRWPNIAGGSRVRTHYWDLSGGLPVDPACTAGIVLNLESPFGSQRYSISTIRHLYQV